MKKRKTIYTAATVITIITVLLLSAILILRSKSLRAMVVSQEGFNQNVVSRDISPELSNIKSLIAKAEFPEDTETVTNVIKTLDNALNAWAECEDLVNSQKIDLQYRKGEIYMGVHEDTANSIYFRFVLQSEKGKIRQCSKIALPTGVDTNETRKTLYQLYFNDDFNIKVYKDSNGMVYFYSSGLIESISYDTPDGKRYSILWSEDGNIIRQGSYDKNKKDPLVLEAEERAREMMKEFHESTQKEYEEYRKTN